MAREISLPFWIVELKLHNGGRVVAPLLMPEVAWLNQEPGMLAEVFTHEFDRHFLREGDTGKLLNWLAPGAWEQLSVRLPIADSGESLLHPEMTLHFEAFTGLTGQGGWLGWVPAAGVSTWADSLDAMESRLKELIRHEFTRRKRLSAVSLLLETQWYTSVSLHPEQIRLPLYTPAEVHTHQTESAERWLPRVACRLAPQEPVAYGLSAELELIDRCVRGEFHGSTLLTGPAGSGKTALIEEYARRHPSLEIWRTNAALLIRELTDGGGWQANLQQLCRELHQSGAILSVSSLTELFEAGQYTGNEMSLGDCLRDPLQRGNIRLVAECTPEEAARIELRTPGYPALFHPVHIPGMEGAALEKIIQQKTSQLARKYQMEVEPAAVRTAVQLLKRFRPYSGFPGKAIGFLGSVLMAISRSRPAANGSLDREAVLCHFCEETGIPRFIIDPEQSMDLHAVREFFRNRLFGQDVAVELVTGLLATIKADVGRTGKPLASLLFAGPTGVGKTELAKLLAEFIFGSRQRLIRFDMSEFADSYAVLRLTGDSAGGREGLLTAAVRQEPFGVILLDELEKADPVFLDLLLQVLGDGRLTDARGRVADFSSSIIIMTSNLGTGQAGRNCPGFTRPADPSAETARLFGKAVEDFFRPELFNRLDQVVPFAPLTPTVIRKVVDKEIEQVQQLEGWRFRPLRISIESPVLDHLGQTGYDTRYGARQLQRIIRHELLTPLAGQLNRYPGNIPLQALARMQNGAIEWEVMSPGPSAILIPLAGQLNPDRADLAEQATRLRREAGQVCQGAVFEAIHDEFHLLDRRRSELKEDFWKQPNLSSRFSELSRVIHLGGESLSRIENLETETNLAGLNFLDTAPAPGDFTAELAREWEAFETELLRAMAPELDRCTVALFSESPAIAHLAQLYLRIGCARAFKTRAVMEKEGNWLDVPAAKAMDHMADLAKCSKVVMEFSEKGAGLFFRYETGFHRWEDGNESNKAIYVRAGEDSFDQAKTFSYLHGSFMKRYQDPKVRRVFSRKQATVRDTEYGEEIYSRNFPEAVQEMLSRRFASKLREVLIQGRLDREEEL